MAFTIGRAGRGSTSGTALALNDPSSWANASFGSSIKGQGGDITLHGWIQNATPAQALVLRDQLLGYQDNMDEPIVPVVCDSEPRLTGYYTVTGVEITTDPTAIATGNLEYTVGLQPTTPFANPFLECIVNGALLTNAVGAVLGDVHAFHAAPSAATEYSYAGVLSTFYTRASADGNIIFLDTGTTLSSIARLGIAPSNYYIGAATFEQGSPLQPVVGRGMAQADVVNWRLSNGLVRVTPNVANPGRLNVSHYNGSTWSATVNYAITASAGGITFTGWNSLVVLRNSVEETCIRLSVATSAGTTAGVVTLDISLRRGDRIARLFLSSTQSLSWRIARTTVEAATAITYGAVTLGGIRATVNDGDSNRYVLLFYQTATPVNDLVNGSITGGASSTTADFGIGSAIGGSTAAAPDRPADLANQYIAAQAESQRVVAR